MESLVAIGLLEKDSWGDVYQSWSYPLTTPEASHAVKNRCQLDIAKTGLIFSRVQDMWHYSILRTNTSIGGGISTHVTHYAIFLLCKIFDPERYESLLNMLHDAYAASGTPLKLMEGFLSVYSKGGYAFKDQKFLDSKWDVRQAYINTSIKKVLQLFGADSMTIWTAMLLKRRIVVFCEEASELLSFIRALPLLVWHRQNWDVLHPFVTMDTMEITQLTSSTTYCAGFVDAAICGQEQLFDLLIDVSAQRLAVSTHAQDLVQCSNTSFHSQMAEPLLQAAERSGDIEEALIKEIAKKTKEVISKLGKLKEAEQLTLDAMEAMNLPVNMPQFLYKLAVAENII